jgi:hypothetical protein
LVHDGTPCDIPGLRGRTWLSWHRPRPVTLATAAHKFITRLRAHPPKKRPATLSLYVFLKELQRILASQRARAWHSLGS